MNVIIIGSGNVAAIFARLITESNHKLLAILSRNINQAKHLAQNSNVSFGSLKTEISDDADLIIVAIADNALSEITGQTTLLNKTDAENNSQFSWREINFKNKLVVHTAGSVSIEVLKTCSAHYGVLYPLQSLRKTVTALPPIPLCVDASAEADLMLLQKFAESLSSQVMRVSDDKRLKLHLSAVVMSNFSNYLYTLTEAYCRKEGIDFSMLYPLINETAQRLQDYAPRQMQTGPAVRGDDNTIKKHEILLENEPELMSVYKFLTKQIMKSYKITSN